MIPASPTQVHRAGPILKGSLLLFFSNLKSLRGRKITTEEFFCRIISISFEFSLQSLKLQAITKAVVPKLEVGNPPGIGPQMISKTGKKT